MLWNFRFKGPRGVEIAVLEAADLSQAEAVGVAFCAEHSMERLKFIRVDGPMVVATAEILKRQAPTAAPEPVLERPSVQEQRESLRRRAAGA
jgi:hypothetical protein